jgi:sugar phosphate isomerase/epimerase
MRLGGPVFSNSSDPDSWLFALQHYGYSAAYCPLSSEDDPATIQVYTKAAQKANVVIAEVGVWNNPLSPDEPTRRDALAKCQTQLALADEIDARCCVNVAGSRGQQWDGPHPHNLTADTFDLIVETVRVIIDAVKPKRTFYTLEPMPWMYPDSADSYLALIKAIDRQQFAVHLDPVNLVSSPQRFHNNGLLIKECFEKLGPYIKSCHGKDIVLAEKLTVHLDEVRPGLGNLDYGVFLQELDKLDPDTPLMVEHLKTEEEYVSAAAYIRSVANNMAIEIR